MVLEYGHVETEMGELNSGCEMSGFMTALSDRRNAQNLLKDTGETVTALWADVRSFNFKWIVPYETAFSPRIMRNPTTWVMFFFGFTPLFGFFAAGSQSQIVGWMLAYFAVAWAAYFYIVVAKRNCDPKMGLAIALFTIFIGFPIHLGVAHLPPLRWFVSLATSNNSVIGLTGWLVGIGANEEFWKAVPVLLVAFLLRRINKPLDGLFYGALSGLGFAVREGIHFLGLSHGADEMLRQVLVRTTEAPFIHATYSAMSGYFIALAVLSPRRRAALCVLGIAVPAILHGSFDYVSDHAIGIVVAALAYLLLISYIDRSQEMLAQLQRTEADASGNSGARVIPEASMPKAVAEARAEVGGEIS